jgi:rSAM-associated Gly-rich repeat protein
MFSRLGGLVVNGFAFASLGKIFSLAVKGRAQEENRDGRAKRNRNGSPSGFWASRRVRLSDRAELKALREMNTSKSFIAMALQLAACAGLLPKDAKASPINTGAGDDTRIAERIARVRQMLTQTANEQMAGQREVNGVRINWADWHKGGWRNAWRNGSRGNWGNGGWGNGAGFRAPAGWANIGWPNGGALVAPGWHKFWFNH